MKKIPEDIKGKYTEIPWQEIAGMRDILVHDYFEIDYEVVWRTIKEDVSNIKPLFDRIANDENR